MRIDNRARNDFSLFEIDTDLCKERQKDNKVHDRRSIRAFSPIECQYLTPLYTLITCFLRNNLVGLRQNTYKRTNPKKEIK
ncbi:hypothetical protein AGMMS49936_06490 [Endomicrobiia bacterium]|nr:hypothetical protein AGMMS49936_06490 [Endomicrobiia bacterium]